MLTLSSNKPLSRFMMKYRVIESKYAVNKNFLQKPCISTNESKEKKATTIYQIPGEFLIFLFKSFRDP